MKVCKSLLLILGILLMIWACAPKETPVATKPTTAATPQRTTPAMEAWQQEWDKAKAEARKEGTVVIAGNVGPATDVIRKELKEKFGINPEYMVGRGAEVVTKIKTEQDAGLYLVDVLLSTTMNILLFLKPEGRVTPIDTQLILPEVKDPKAWYRGELPWVDKEKRYHLAFFAIPELAVFVNTQMVNPKDFKSYNDFLDLKWKGKILVNDPTVTGAGNSWFSAVADAMGLDYFKKLIAQEPVVLRDERLLAEWVARGKYPILLGTDEKTTTEFIKAGAPLEGIQLREGTFLTQANGAISIATKAPHPNAAKVVLNWILTKEGGKLLSEQHLSQSARVDVPSDFLPAASIRQPGVTYIDQISEEYTFKKDEYVKRAKEIFEPYLKK